MYTCIHLNVWLHQNENVQTILPVKPPNSDATDIVLQQNKFKLKQSDQSLHGLSLCHISDATSGDQTDLFKL